MSLGVIQSVQGNRVSLDVGQAQGVAMGSVYAVFSQVDALFKGPELGRIEIAWVGQVSSEAVILGNAPIRPGDRVREVLHQVGEEKLKLRLEVTDYAMQAELLEWLGRMDFIKITESDEHFDRRLRISASSSGLEAVLIFDGVPGEKVRSGDVASLVAGLRSQLANAYVINSLYRLDNPAPPFEVSVWANRVGQAEPGTLGQAPDERFVQARVGDVIRFNFRAGRDCYLTMINVDVHGEITVLFPNQFRPDGRIQGGRTYRTETEGEMPFQIRAMGPPGRELVKVIATLEPLNLSSLKMGEEGGMGTRSIAAGTRFVEQLVRDLAVLPMDAEGEEYAIFLPTEGWTTDYLIIDTKP